MSVIIAQEGDTTEALLQNEEAGAVNGPVDIERRLYLKEKLEEKRQRLKDDIKELLAFKREELAKIDEQETWIDNQMIAYIENARGGEPVRLPRATVGLQRRTKKHWPGSDDLVTWSKQMGLPVRTSEGPDKEAISSFIEETSHRPPGYDETEETSLCVRARKKDEDTGDAGDEVSFPFL